MLTKENKLGAIKNGLRCLRGNIIVKKRICIGDITIILDNNVTII